MKKYLSIFCVIITLLAFAACESPFSPSMDNPDGITGNIVIGISDGVSRSILPGISMDPAYYVIEGSGPAGAVFSETASGTVTVEGLQHGEWTVTATAYNDTDTAIGAGSATADVASGSSVSVSITVRPYDGFGTLDLALNWIEEQVYLPQVESTLTPAVGAARTLDFSIDGSQAVFTAADIATGYHTLTLKLLDNGFLNMGAVEVVRIVKDAVSTGSFTFDEINQATGHIEVNITAEMGDPLEISILGAAETKPQNKSMALTAEVSNFEKNVTYVWYVNADAVDTGDSFTFDDSWAQGYYRVDVTGYSANGSRAGSAYAYVEVVEAEEQVYVPFISVWDMSLTDTNTLEFPLVDDGNYDFTIDWGDGAVENFTDADVSHTYANAAEYIVTVTGLCEGFGFAITIYENTPEENTNNLVDIMQWGDVVLNNEGGKFAYCENITDFSATDTPDLTVVTNLAGMFRNASGFNGNISGWNVSNVTDMNNMFYGAKSFNQDFSDWDTSSVTNMLRMFSGASSFNGNISNWNVSNVTSMNGMFYKCSVFDQDISAWDVSSVTDMTQMFYNAVVFNQDISEWNTPALTGMMHMFANCELFNQDLSGWDVSNVSDMREIFRGCSVFNGDISEWDTSNATLMNCMFFECHEFNQDLSNWDVSHVTDMGSMFYECTVFNQDISNWNTSSIHSMGGMFYNCAAFNQDVSGWDVSNCVYLGNLFYGCSEFNCGNIDISTWDWDFTYYVDGNDFIGTLLEGNEPDWYLELL